MSMVARLDASVGAGRRAWLARRALGIGLVAAAYYVTAKAGLHLAYLHGTVTALWPPVGVGVAALLLWGPGLWPGVVIGDLLVGDFSSPLGTVLGQTTGNTLEVLVAALLLRRLLRGRTGLERVVDVLALGVCAAIGTAVSASFGVVSLRLGNVIPASQAGEVWRTWWLSDLSGALVVTPAILAWAAIRATRFSRQSALEGLLVLGVLVTLVEVPNQRDVPYIVFPALIWAALRFGTRGAATAVLITSCLTIWNTAHNAGPFVRASITNSLLSTQLFIAVAALTGLVLAAVTAERVHADEALRANEERLRSVVHSMAEGLIVRNALGLVTDANAAAERVFGLGRSLLVGRRPDEVLADGVGEDGEPVPADRLLGGPTLATGQPEDGLVVRFARPDASAAWVSVSSGAVRDAAGRPEGVVTTLSDITARREAERAERALADEQAALRRIATLVAEEAESASVFQQVTAEVCRVLDAPSAGVLRFEADGCATVVGVTRTAESPGLSVGEELPVDEGGVMARVRATGKAQRLESYDAETGALVERLRSIGVRSSVAAPVAVGGRLWGALVASSLDEPLPLGAERRLTDFADLVAQALANADAHEKLAASRARIVEAGDTERRRLERNLHDGAQQRLVSLALQLRIISGKLANDPEGARALVTAAQTELEHALAELRELARGIHPAVLSERGLGPALTALVERAPVDVELVGLPDTRLPEAVEAAVYYVVAEALTNVAKYAGASRVEVSIGGGNEHAVVVVADDGIGGADPVQGSGLRGLADRVEALGGRLRVESPPGGGTRIEAELPVSS